jgi:DNA polymerase (family 10)
MVLAMKNFEVAKILKEIAIFLEMDDIPFKPRAYEKAARSVEAVEEDLQEIYKKGGIKVLEEIPGVGQRIAEKIEELIKTGKLAYYDELRKKVPVNLESLSRIEGLGPKTIKTLWKELKIKNTEDLERAALSHQISKLHGFKEKTEQNILKETVCQKKQR